MESVTEAAEQVTETTNWATVALVAVAALSLIGLAVGITALNRSIRADQADS